jgi:hypothetical protein
VRHPSLGGVAAFAFLGAALAACVTAPAPQQPPPSPRVAAPPPKVPTVADELVAYLARLRTLDEAGLAAEAARQRDFARADPGEVNRLKVALALAAASGSDEGDVVALVEPLSRETPNTDPDVRAMASFLQGMMVERRRLKEAAATAGKASQNDRKAYESQKQRADVLQERNTQLQQKLDALTNLEKSLSNRKGN